MRKVLKAVLIIVLILAAAITSGIIYITSGLNSGQQLKLSGIEPTNISDGTYNGKYEAGRWSNEISVTVLAGRITEISLIDDVTFAKEETTQELFNKVVTAQDTCVDTVSGATVTCKAYLKAIENALNQNG